MNTVLKYRFILTDECLNSVSAYRRSFILLGLLLASFTVGGLAVLYLEGSLMETVRYEVEPETILSREDVLQLIEGSTMVDPREGIVHRDAVSTAELKLMMVNWERLLSELGDYERIYVSTTPVGVLRYYWYVEYSSRCTKHGCNYGEYIVDARTGEVIFLREDRPMPALLSLFITVESEAPRVSRDESLHVKVTLDGRPDYDIPWPPSFWVESDSSVLTLSKME